MHISLHHFAAVIVTCWTLGIMAQEPKLLAANRVDEAALPPPAAIESSHPEAINDPVADPKAVVIFGKARFTVLTPELIRMEWAADAKFEDHASLRLYQSPLAGSTVFPSAFARRQSTHDQDRRADAYLFPFW